MVTHRQQPATAKGTVFLNLEDETGLDQRDLHRRACGSGSGRSPAARPRCGSAGVLEKHQGVINLVAGRIDALPLSLADLLKSRDFH